MNSRVASVMLGLVLIATVAGFALLYRLRLNQGDSFPAYSSLRADPLGTRVFYDSLAEVGGLNVTRRFRPLAELAVTPVRTIVLAGFDHRQWSNFDPAEFTAIDHAVRSGSRVIVALRRTHNPERSKPLPTAETKKVTSEQDPKRAVAKKVLEKRGVVSIDAGAGWGVKLAERWLVKDARREEQADPDLPGQLTLNSDVYFALPTPSAWSVVYRRGGEPVMIERTIGRGNLVILSDSFPLSNEALQRDRATGLLSWLIGTHAVIEFDESHLGLAEDRGLAALAKQYGLAGAFLTLLVAAGLLVWNRTALFVPPLPDGSEVALNYNQTAGLEALLRRAIAPKDLTSAAVAEWRRTAPRADIARVDAALQAMPKALGSVATYNILVQALRRR